MDTVTWVDILLAVIAACSLVVAGLARHDASAAKRTADRANNLAGDANDIAKDANKLSRDANDISEQALDTTKQTQAQANEEWLVEWKATWLREPATIVIENVGRDVALQPSAMVKGPSVNLVFPGLADTPRGSTHALEIDGWRERMSRIARSNADRMQRAKSRGIGLVVAGPRETVVVRVHWRTGLGQPRNQELELVID